MSLVPLLGDISPRQFLDDFFLKQPFSRPGGAKHLVELGRWPTVEAILSQPGVDMMLARQGKLWEGRGQPNYEEVRRLHDEGYTLVIRSAERSHAGLAELARGFERDFAAAVNVHVYCTPDEQYGFGWHYDAEDVFIIQTEGSKEYSLRKNTVNPWPLVETMPGDMRFEREIMPVMKCQLAAGDWLYIPAGYWHVGRSQQAAISLAVGVMSATALDALAFLRRQLPDSLLWRQRLRPAGELTAADTQQLMREYREVFTLLGEDLKRRLSSEEFARSFLAERSEA
jgi:ribosomal protein L16 Arg81 hydroxylase